MCALGHADCSSELHVQSWRDGSVVKCICCSCREIGLVAAPKRCLRTICHSSTRDLMPSFYLWWHQACTWYRDRHVGKTFLYTKVKENKFVLKSKKIRHNRITKNKCRLSPLTSCKYARLVTHSFKPSTQKAGPDEPLQLPWSRPASAT